MPPLIQPPPMPGVAVIPHQKIDGAESLSSGAASWPVVPWEQAFMQPWGSDAHFAPYRIEQHGQALDTQPRLNKPILEEVRKAGGMVVAPMVVLDVDNAGHRPWDPESLDAFRTKMTSLQQEAPAPFRDWSLWYTTRAGARVVWVLDHPAQPEVAESMSAWLRTHLKKFGVLADPACKSWNWLYRLPMVVREGKNTWEAWSFEVAESGRRAAAKEFGREEPATRKETAGKALPGEPRPSDDEALGCLRTISRDTGKSIQAPWYREVRRYLYGKNCFGAIFHEQPIAEEGKRDDTLIRVVGECLGACWRAKDPGADGPLLTPLRLYALFMRSVEHLACDAGTPSWKDKLWYIVRYCWGHQERKLTDDLVRVEETQALAVQKTETLAGRMIEGMRKWCTRPELQGDDSDALAFMLYHMIAMAPSGEMHILGPDGMYDPLPVRKDSLLPRVRALGVGELVQTTKEDKNGEQVPLDPRVICARQGTLIGRIVGLPGFVGGRIRDIDSGDPTLEMGLYSLRKDIPKAYDADVDRWLTLLFGSQHLKGKAWLGHALDFEGGPIAALALTGAGGAGKKMLCHGLAECITTRAFATARDLVGDYGYGLIESPFLIIDEGWPTGAGKRHAADAFREIVGGSVQHINRKFLQPMQVRSPTRVIFTANGISILQVLVDGRDLSPEDRDALGQRLIHISVDSASKDWLRDRGGLAYTGATGAAWIAGDGGAPSNHILASHLLWLHENRPESVGTRFLVEGDAKSDVMGELRTEGALVPYVIEAVLRMLELKKPLDGLAILKGGRVMVTASQLTEFLRDNIPLHGEKVTARRVGHALRGLTVGAHDDMVVEGKEPTGRKKWHELDVPLLHQMATRDGWKATRVEEMMKERLASRIGRKGGK